MDGNGWTVGVSVHVVVRGDGSFCSPCVGEG